ncbi:FecR family protein [Ottowia sp.]|jgi:hypothetical protein|uniref:FecR family protein n=1 Tax=Ottowia sp. TaxID=1898956 RepID=UPI0025FDD374|nr:FecR family protein [Ottowia sp.]MBK6613498.1 FecR domain-containing protein [Ottowia sp.]MBK6747397.1 FecR domain-containing protein [Ottowia sp.]
MFHSIPVLARAIAGALLLAASAALAQAPAPVPTGASSAAEPAPTPGDAREGTFKTVQGEVTLVRGATRSAAVVGDALREGDRVLTGPRSAAAVTLTDGTILSIGPDSAVDLAQFRFEPTTQDGNVLVTLLRGSLRMVTGLIAKLKPEQVKVTTPTTVIGVRGTDFIVEQAP